VIYLCFFLFLLCDAAMLARSWESEFCVRLSFCLSHAYFVSQSKELTSNIFIPHERVVLLVF